MALTRRNVLRGAAIAGASLAAPVHWADMTARAAVTARLQKFTDPLPVPPFVNATGGGTVQLRMKNAMHAFHSSLAAGPTLAYQVPGSPTTTYLGPTLVAKKGVPLTVNARNDIATHPLAASLDPALHGTLPSDSGQARTAVHLHGGNTRPASDGGPEDTFPYGHTGSPGFSNPYPYLYDNTQEAAGLWYHDHALGITRLNVYAGLAAGYVLRDDNDTGDGTKLPAALLNPQAPYDYEVPLILQDKTLNRDGSQFYDPAPWAPEFFGRTPVVNGTAYPFMPVARGQYRFRLYNGSNARFYQLSLKERLTGATLPFLQIGSDGGLLDNPVPMARLLIAPGERADLVVDFAGLPTDAVVEMLNSAATPFPGASPNARNGGATIGNIMQFRVMKKPGWQGPRITPATDLRGLGDKVDRLDDVTPARTRTHSLIELMNPDGTVMMATLNNRTFVHPDYQSDPVSRDTVEVWEFANTTPDAHPIHLHLVQFQVLDREPFDPVRYLADKYPPAGAMLQPNEGPFPAPSADGYSLGPAQPPAPNEMGWKDTVQAPPGMITRIIVPFGQAALPGRRIAANEVHVGDYVWHCHILEHEDNEMMQKYRIV